MEDQGGSTQQNALKRHGVPNRKRVLRFQSKSFVDEFKKYITSDLFLKRCTVDMRYAIRVVVGKMRKDAKVEMLFRDDKDAMSNTESDTGLEGPDIAGCKLPYNIAQEFSNYVCEYLDKYFEKLLLENQELTYFALIGAAGITYDHAATWDLYA